MGARLTIARLRVLVAAGIVLALPCAAGAQLVVTPSVTHNGSFWHYDYSVTNADPSLDVPIISIQERIAPDTVQNLTAPAGFQASFDTGLGLLDLLEDSSTFGINPVSGFELDSPYGPAATTYTALAIDQTGNPVDLAGQTVGAQTPEPGCLALIGAFATGGTLFARRKWAIP